MRFLLWFFGILITVSIVMFFTNPSMFTQRGSMWSEYDQWESNNLSTTSYDLFKPIGNRTVELADEPFMSVMHGDVEISLYEVTYLSYDGSWPYNDILDSRKETVDNMVYFGAIAKKEDKVIAKNLVYVTEDVGEYVKLDENTFYKEYENGNLLIDIFVIDYHNPEDTVGWTDETVEFYKRWVYNDLDKEVRVHFSLVEANS